MSRKRTLSMGSDDEDNIVDDVYQLDLTPPEVEESIILIKKQSPQVARQKKRFFKSLNPEVACSTHVEA